MKELGKTSAWQRFAQAVEWADRHAGHLRILPAAGLKIDVSAQAWSPELEQAGAGLLAEQGFEQAREALFEGGIVNWTENRPAWHTALRSAEPPAGAAGDVLAERARMRGFVDWANSSNLYRNVVHLGIGGSDWGPRLALEALGSDTNRRTVRFASNIDAHAIDRALAGLEPRDTLVIVASKSFTTAEPLANARCALQWLREAGIESPYDHLVAVTANRQAARDFGIPDERIFSLWDWVGGRYSVWSSIGLPIALGLGLDAFDQMLAGAADMDAHFRTADIAHNAPVQMALAAVANRSVLGFGSLAVAPYDARLANFIPWLQQLEMESLGKTATRDGSTLDVPAGVAVWGMPGTDAQHTFFQWLHQDGQGAPVDFILCAQPSHDRDDHHRMLVANCLAQRAALLRGKSYAEALEENLAAGMDAEQAALLAHHRVHPGGRPSTLIVMPSLTAHSLGALLALYEHKVFVEGVLWGINPFDQWGVEFGKALAKHITQQFDDPQSLPVEFDASTAYWVRELAGR
jgi:Glucose-6-phosphate isomerase